ncbi:hypothetical protein SEVIR_2G301250v4 [Setaria viridis]
MHYQARIHKLFLSALLRLVLARKPTAIHGGRNAESKPQNLKASILRSNQGRKLRTTEKPGWHELVGGTESQSKRGVKRKYEPPRSLGGVALRDRNGG